METTALTVQARAAVALGSSKAEAELTALALQSKSITSVTSPDGRTECHAAAMAAKTARIGIEKAGKAARDDATQFSKAVIAEEKYLVGLIEPEEIRLTAMRDGWDEKIAAEKAAKAESERIALAAIVKRIDTIKAWPLDVADATSKSVLDEIEQLEAMEIDDSFKDHYGEAVEAKAASLAKLREIYAAKTRAEAEALRIKQEREAEDARLKAEREELDRQRAEQDRIDAQRRAEREEEDRKAKELRDEQERQLQAQREELARQQKVIDEQRAEQERIRKEAEAKAEAARKSAEEAVTKPETLIRALEVNQQVTEDKAGDQKPATAPACDSYRPVIQPNAEMIEPIFKIGNEPMDAMKKRLDAESEIIDQIQDFINDMRCNELSLVLHYCERIVSDRQPVAA